MSWISRLRNAIRPAGLDKDLNDEIADHLQRRAAELKAKGLSDAEARRQASLRFGNATNVLERSRDLRLWPQLESTLLDVGYAWRGIRNQPVFALTAIVSLALAIAATSAIYSIVEAAILRPLPVRQPGQLFLLTSPEIVDPGAAATAERESFSYPQYLAFKQAAESEQLAVFSFGGPAEVRDPAHGGAVQKFTRAFMSGNGFDMLGIHPAGGRLFTAGEDRGPTAVAVISYDLWTRNFERNPAAIGRDIVINGKGYQIVGVAARGFFGIEPGKFVDIWLPATDYDERAFSSAYWNWLRIIGRFAGGNSVEQIQARLQPSFHQFELDLVKEMPTIPPVIRKQLMASQIHVRPAPSGASSFRQAFSRPLWIVFGVAAGILLIACANVAGLLLARSTARVGEMAMRVSLGAGRLRLMRQLLTESLVLSLIAGAMGWFLARLCAPLLLIALSTQDDPVQFVLGADWRALLFSAMVSAGAAILFGVIPALRSSAVRPIRAIRASAFQSDRHSLGKAFVMLQVAGAFCLVVAGASFLFSLLHLFRVNPGFDPSNVAVLTVTPGPGAKVESALPRMFQLQNRLEGLPGIQGVASAPWPNFGGGGWSEQVIIPGKGPSQQEEILYRVSPRYFATLRTPLLSGRDFAPRDSANQSPSAAIVNEAFARKYFNTTDVLGRGFSFPSEKGQVQEVIVGVASDARYNDLRRPADPIVYLPFDEGENTFSLFVRSPMDLPSVVRLVNREAAQTGSGRVDGVTTLETIIGNTLRIEKLLGGVGGVLAFFGLLLAGIGLFGMLAYSVGRRTKEIGIRGALGARKRKIVSLVLTDAGLSLCVGLAVGLASGLLAIHAVQPLLFEVGVVDAPVIGTAIAIFLVTGLLASCIPAIRAAAIDPVRALREE